MLVFRKTRTEEEAGGGHALRMLVFRKTKLRRGNEGWGQPASSLQWVCRTRQAHCTALPDWVREEMKSCLFATKVKSNNIDVVYKKCKRNILVTEV